MAKKANISIFARMLIVFVMELGCRKLFSLYEIQIIFLFGFYLAL